jgi:hypothetical protein
MASDEAIGHDRGSGISLFVREKLHTTAERALRAWR